MAKSPETTPETTPDTTSDATPDTIPATDPVNALALLKSTYALSGYKTVLIPIKTDLDGSIISQRLATLPQADIPADAIEIGDPAPVRDDGQMAIISDTGGIAFVPAGDLKDLPGFSRAVAGVHFSV